VCEGQTIHIRDLPQEIGRHYADSSDLPPESIENRLAAAGVAPVEDPHPGLTPIEAAEAVRIREALEEARFRRGEAARRLGMSRTTLWRKMKQYRLG